MRNLVSVLGISYHASKGLRMYVDAIALTYKNLPRVKAYDGVTCIGKDLPLLVDKGSYKFFV